MLHNPLGTKADNDREGFQFSYADLRFGVFDSIESPDLTVRGLRSARQPIDILVRLLQRPGEVVTREELQKDL